MNLKIFTKDSEKARTNEPKPEDVEDFKQGIYRQVENCNGKIKEKLDEILFKEHDGFRPVSERLPDFNLNTDDIYNYCRAKKAEKLIDLVNEEVCGGEIKIGDEVKKKIGMIESVKTGRYNLMQLSRLDDAVTNYENLMKIFNVKEFSIKPKEGAPPLEKVAVLYGINLIQTYVNNRKPSIMFTDDGINTYFLIKELTEKYIERDMLNDLSKDIRNYIVPRQILSKIQEKFDEKYLEFQKRVEKVQDRFHNQAKKQAGELNPLYKKTLDKFDTFSRVYLQILEEDNDTLRNAKEEVRSIKQEAYKNATEEKQLAFCKGEGNAK